LTKLSDKENIMGGVGQMLRDRYKVRIRCNTCGERFTLVGKKGKTGQIQTGFKQCLCNNEQDFNVSTEQL
jgi:hypothetical protein